MLGVHNSSKIWSIWEANGSMWWEQYFSPYRFQCRTLACWVSVHFVLLNSNSLWDSYLLIGHLISFGEREIAAWKRFVFSQNFFQFCVHFLSVLKSFDIWYPWVVSKITWLPLCQNKQCILQAVCLPFSDPACQQYCNANQNNDLFASAHTLTISPHSLIYSIFKYWYRS